MSIVDRVSKLFEQDQSHWKEIYLAAEDDLAFQSDEKFAQWDADAAQARYDSGRPVLSIDQLGQFIHQVSNDIRMNTPTIGVIPSGGEASQETAEIYKGLIRNIEYKSQADDAYDLAADFAVRCSIGFITIKNDYEDDDSFNQELIINRVVDPFSCFIDSNSIEVDGRDAMRGYELVSIPKDEFKERWPEKNAVSFGEDGKEAKDGEYVTICYFYEIEETEKRVGMDETGNMVDAFDDVEYRVTRTIKKRKVKCSVLSGEEELESSIFPGKYIPIVPVYGEEMWNKGKRYLHSLIRKSKDAQRMFNYWKSLETELLMKQPNAPVMVAEGQIEDYADDWKNPGKTMALRYKTVDAQGNPAPAPQRLEPPVIPTGIVNAARETVEDIKSTMGLYNAAIGMRSNEISGIAIQRRQEEGSVATYHFADNLNKSIAHVGRILVCAIPEVYDAPRIIRIIDEEENPKEVGINGAYAEEQEIEFDLKRGKYDVKVIPGASYTTRRQEAAEFFSSLVTRQPELMNVMGDLMFANMDFTGAQAMAERMKKIIDPKFLNEEEEVDPEKEQMALAIQQGEQVIAQLQATIAEKEQELDNKQAELMIKAKSEQNKAEADAAKNEIERLKLVLEQEKANLEREKLATDRMKFEAEAQYKMTALALKEKELAQRDIKPVSEMF